MGKPAGPKPSPALIVAFIALVVALAGTAVGGVALNRLNNKEKHQVTKIASRQASKRINERAPGLSVASAVDAERLGGKPAGAFAAANSEPTGRSARPASRISKTAGPTRGDPPQALPPSSRTLWE